MQQSRRLGSALRQGLLLLYRPPHPSSPFAFCRSFGSSKLFVGGLSFRTQEDALRNAFAAHGEVTDVRIVMDRETGRSRGFGFITFLSEDDAETAFSKMNGKILDGRAIRVDRASARPPAPRPMGDAPGFNPGSGSSSDFARSPAFDSSPPVQEDWGAIPSFNAEVSQNTSSSVSVESKSTDISTESSTFDLPPVASPPFTSSPSTTSFDLPEIGNNASTGPLPFAGSKPDDPAPYRPSFDFGNFSSFQSSSYDDEPPLPRRKPRPRPRPISQSVPNFNFGSTLEGTSSPFGSTSEFETIAKPKGPEFDFGLSGIGSSPPQSEPGARPQGGFDIDIPADCGRHEAVKPPPKPKPSGFSIFQPRIVAPEGLPYDTPEADNWSEIGEDPPKLYLTSIYSPLRGFVSKDKELHWDPYNFDEDAKLPEPEVSEDAKPPESELSVA